MTTRTYLLWLFCWISTTSVAQIDICADTIPESPLVEKFNWGTITHRGNPWTQLMSRPYQPTKGLKGRHLSVAASHGYYYDLNKSVWAWQRPTLYCTTEDLLTQTFTVPFLNPMLERAGAVVWSPRERAWMREEIIVDNDAPQRNGTYTEQDGKHHWQGAGSGFAQTRDVYLDNQNPHLEGTARLIEAQTSKRMLAQVQWTPQIPREGDYAVYVTYPALPTHIPDAQYTIRHKGINTLVRVNQQMGGGTWVYLGTFDFSPGNEKDNFISLSNLSHYNGTVAADAVRLGGGMGNVARCDTLGQNLTTSGLPRYLEAARYNALWHGMPESVYNSFLGKNDYSDDIRTRPNATNYLARGGAYLPGDSGLCVPLELSLALHSDAGFRTDMSHIGSLGIYTSDFEEGVLPSGLSRKTSGRLTETLLRNVRRDFQQLHGRWEVRKNMDANYGETRIPHVPSVIFEMFSHQNFAEMKLAHDPMFKFHMARSIYKSVLQYCSQTHGDLPYAVQPLPVQSFAVQTEHLNGRFCLSWQPTPDALEPTAMPDSYILYMAKGERGWDNGQVVNGTSCYVEAEPDVLYRFKVEALNEGGASLPSEELCAMLSSQPQAPTLLIVNGFTRLAGPQPIDTDTQRGFDVTLDPGVAYHATPEYCGPQLVFTKEAYGKEKEEELGHSSQAWIGMLQKGNTFDYPTLHARDILSAMPCHISSSSRKALEDGIVSANAYRLMDLIMGAQRGDGYSWESQPIFTPQLKEVLQQFTLQGGALLLSGAYTGIDVQQGNAGETARNTAFTQRCLHWSPQGEQRGGETLEVTGMNTHATLTMVPNETHLSTPRVSILQATGTAFPILTYPNQQPAAVAYKGLDYRAITLGFPIEQLNESHVRQQLMGAFLRFLLY